MRCLRSRGSSVGSRSPGRFMLALALLAETDLSAALPRSLLRMWVRYRGDADRQCDGSLRPRLRLSVQSRRRAHSPMADLPSSAITEAVRPLGIEVRTGLHTGEHVRTCNPDLVEHARRCSLRRKAGSTGGPGHHAQVARRRGVISVCGDTRPRQSYQPSSCSRGPRPPRSGGKMRPNTSGSLQDPHSQGVSAD